MSEVTGGAPGEPAAASTSGPGPTVDAWKALGRDSPAGKALFKLYNGDFKGQQAGSAYHDRNKQKHQAKIAAGWTPPVPEPEAVVQRPQVNYPKFGTAKPSKDSPIAHVPRRKPASQIVAEMEAARHQSAAQRPVPAGPLLDDREKERCALLMRYRGQVPAEALMLLGGARPAARQPQRRQGAAGLSEEAELTQLFQQVVSEIEERRQFLRDMEAAGGLKRDVQHMVTNEIRQRVADLEALDLMMHGAGGRQQR